MTLIADIRIRQDEPFAKFSLSIRNGSEYLLDSVDYPVLIARREEGRKLF